jgi:hypothetical protein
MMIHRPCASTRSPVKWCKHVYFTLLTRIIACRRVGTPYQLRDTDGAPLPAAQGLAIVAERYRISDELRA